MKKKTINIVLGLGLLIIWGFVTKRALFYFGNTDEDKAVLHPIAINDPLPKFKKDTFELAVLDRDPFLDVMANRKTTIPKTLPKTSKKNIAPVRRKESNVNWPKLQYFGYLKGDSQSGKLAIIKIDNKLHRVREKKSVEDVQVLKIYKDSVLLKRNGMIKILEK
ncbi:hypothetical protein [Flagellimonas onchidii]|uniref:hypothetical protein n=1 Tax=Flagellimonas onchidii TaxID=2562684 RepID=UPI0010A631D4|nr:hypothetical protein [Allomuricauda onchidii]